MENYVPTNILSQYFGIEINKEIGKSKELLKHLLNTNRINISNNKDKKKIIKQIINGSLSQKITLEDLKKHGVEKEITLWFKEMSNWKKNI